MGGLIVAGEIKTPNLIDMLDFAYALSEHDGNYKYSLNVQPRILRFERSDWFTQSRLSAHTRSCHT